MTRSTASQKRRGAIVTLIFAAVVLLPSLWGFSGKFADFIAIYRGDMDGIFALSPIVNYLLASLGFFCLFGWAAFQGMFSDMEQPKVTFLETEAMLDRLQSCSEQQLHEQRKQVPPGRRDVLNMPDPRP
jgi:hypothetical protein